MPLSGRSCFRHGLFPGPAPTQVFSVAARKVEKKTPSRDQPRDDTQTRSTSAYNPAVRLRPRTFLKNSGRLRLCLRARAPTGPAAPEGA